MLPADLYDDAPHFPAVEPDWSTPEADWAERAVVGTILIWPERDADVRDRLRLEDFHDVIARTVWQGIRTVADRGAAPDALTVKAELERTGAFQPFGFPSAYARLLDGIPRGIDLAGRVDAVLEAARFRRLQRIGWDLCRSATLMSDTPDDVIARGEALLQGLGANTARGLATGEALTAGALARFQAALEGHAPGLRTGLRDFDHLTGGLKPGQLVILAGRPGTGKTSLAATIAWHVASADKVVLFVTLEMGRDELADRFACLQTGLGYADVMAAQALTDAERGQHITAHGHLEASGLGLVERARTVPAVRQQAKALAAIAGRLDLIVVDYLQLMRSDAVKRGDNRVYEIGDISIELKALALELQVPVIALAQLNRQVEQRADRKPQLSDLRDSGQIEQDADLVAFTHWAEGTPSHMRQLLVRKHRNGPTAELTLRWTPQCMRFDNWS